MKRILLALLLLATPFESACVSTRSSVDAIEAAVADPRRSDADRKRDETSKPVAVLTFFGVEPGMRVLDLLSGGGYYSEILSRAVGPDGTVVAQNSDVYAEYDGEEIAERYRDDRLSNVERLRSNPPDLKLGSESFDLVLMIMTYHDIYYVSEADPKHPKIDRDHFLAQVHRCLRPGGVLAVVDHAARRGTGRDAAQDLHRIDEEFAREDIEAAGFVFDGASDLLRNPDDDRTMLVFDDRIRRRTDRFVYRFIKPKSLE